MLLQNKLHIYNIKNAEWSTPEVQGSKPSAIRAHTATLINKKYMVVLGGYDY